MALKDILKTKKTSTKAKPASKEKKVSTGVPSTAMSSHVVIKHPRITEKAAFLAEKNVYTFEIDARANKIEVKRAVKEIYGFTALSVNVVNIPQKNVVIRGKRGKQAGVRKAYVALKKGDVIEFA